MPLILPPSLDRRRYTSRKSRRASEFRGSPQQVQVPVARPLDPSLSSTRSTPIVDCLRRRILICIRRRTTAGAESLSLSRCKTDSARHSFTLLPRARLDFFCCCFGRYVRHDRSELDRTVVSHRGCRGSSYQGSKPQSCLIIAFSNLLFQSAESSVRVWSLEAYTKVEEYAELQGRLRDSLSRQIVWLEYLRFRLLRGPLPPDQVLAVREHLEKIQEKNGEGGSGSRFPYN
jgi:hypothetical protein